MNRHFVNLGILAAITLFLFLFGLGNMPLTDPDETFYAETAREMINNNDWVTPTIFGEPQFEKPIFYYWLIMLSYTVFGIGEFAARFPSAIFGILGVFGVYFLGSLLFSRKTGFFSALIAATSVQYIVLSRASVTDMVLMVSILYCLVFFLRGWATGGRGSYLIASAAAGVAVLTKGPIGLFIPGMIVLVFVTVTRQWRTFGRIPFVWGGLIFFLIALPWYAAATKLHTSVFLNEFFGFQNITRFIKPEHEIGSNPLFYIPVLLGGFFPWSVFLPAGAWYFFRERPEASRVAGYRSFLLSWFLVVFVFFSVSRTRLVTYIFPLWPVMAIVAGRLWERYASFSDDGLVRKKTAVSYLTLVSLSLAGIIGLCVFMAIEYPAALAGTALSSSVFASVLLGSLFLYMKEKRSALFMSIVISIAVLSFPLDMFVMPVIGAEESSKDLCLWINELAEGKDPVAGESDLRRGIAFYTGRIDIPDVQNYQKLVDFFSQDKKAWGIIKKKHYAVLDKNKPGLVSKPLLCSGKKVLVTNNVARSDGADTGDVHGQ